jgi:hypothetical protein
MEVLSRAHSGLRWVVLILLLAAIFKALSGWLNKRPFTNGDRKLALFAMISVHTQLLIGLVLYVLYLQALPVSFGESMHRPELRFFTVEHIIGMLIAVALITVGNGKAKRGGSDKAKHKGVAVFYIIGLVIILAMIPWPFMSKFAGFRWF